MTAYSLEPERRKRGDVFAGVGAEKTIFAHSQHAHESRAQSRLRPAQSRR